VVSRQEQRRIPHIRELAVVGDYAVIGGHSAFFLGRLLGGYPGGLERLLARSGIPAERCEDVLKAVAALVHVGTTWQLEQESGSGSASGTRRGAEVGSPVRSSSHDGFSKSTNGTPSMSARETSPFLGTSEAAVALGVSTRLVRRLASTGALRGQRDAGGRWQFAAADVAAERDRRVSERRERSAVA
jgi:excisionase family DNA binding protein